MGKRIKKRRLSGDAAMEVTDDTAPLTGAKAEVMAAARAAWKASDALRSTTNENEHVDSDANESDQDDSETVPEPTQEGGGLFALGDPLERSTNNITASGVSQLGIPRWLAEPAIIAADQQWPVDDARVGLSSFNVQRCRNADITQLFAVQTAVIPRLLRPGIGGDLCVSAPTGSGKTLAYVLPIIETLRERVVIRLRALIVLPTRDLVLQVKETFDEFCRGSSDLKVGVALGQTSFEREQTQLVADLHTPLLGGSSRVDVLIATPGRLMDHLQGTPNFSLQHLRFLVIDEADRLLDQSYQEWLPRVLDELATPPPMPRFDIPAKPVHDAVAFEFPRVAGLVGPPVSRAQKLLFSATLTRNPAKIASLRLHRPSYISVQGSTATDDAADGSHGDERYTTPATLEERYIVCQSEEKPLYVVHLLERLQLQSVLCFTKSVESTRRLSRLLQLYYGDANEGKQSEVAEYSSELAPSERSAIMRRFKQGKLRLLICSDLVTRGVDLDCVQAVISYDVPLYVKKYIHRVGRTARAGRSGAAYTLVETQEARYFKEMMRKAHHWEKIKRLNVRPDEVATLNVRYEKSLAALQALVQPHRIDHSAATPNHAAAAAAAAAGAVDSSVEVEEAEMEIDEPTSAATPGWTFLHERLHQQLLSTRTSNIR